MAVDYAPTVSLDMVSSGSATAKIPALLTFCIVAIFVFPPDMVIGPIGAVGFAGMVSAMLIFVIWLALSLFGHNNPIGESSPARLGLGIFWIVSIVAYLSADPQYVTAVSRAAADRFLLTLIGMSGLVLGIGSLRNLGQLARVVGALSVGATFCGLVAIYQFVTLSDPMDWIRSLMIGWTENGGNTTFQVRSPFTRVAGSTFHPIELGVVSSMILPLAIWRLIFDRDRRRGLAWFQVSVIVAGAVMTVSRSAILALVIVSIFFIPALPPAAKRWAMFVVPGAATAVFVAIPGFVTVVTSLFTAGTDDPSLATRVNNYPRVAAFFRDNPLTGIGPGAYVPRTALQIFDNQYLGALVTLGLLGLLGFIGLMLMPLASNIQISILTRSPALKCLAGGVAAGMAVATVTSGTFDSLSFPVFTIILSVFIGLSASLWRIAQAVPTRYDTGLVNEV